MNLTPQRRQTGRIARLLDLDTADLLDLEEASGPDLAVLHDQISNVLFADGQHRFARVASLSKTLPGPVAGKLAERFLPPVIAARVAELLEPARARDLVNRVSVRYLGDLALQLDPVRSKPVVQAIPAPRVGEVARELFGRGEYAAMAEFVGTVTVDALFAALKVATPHDLLAVVPLLEWNDNVDHVIANLPAEQVAAIVRELDAVELADLALAVDPSRFGPIVHAVPLGTVADIARELFARGEYAGMASFVDVVNADMMHSALGVATSRDLLEIAPFLTWNIEVQSVVDVLSVDILDGVVAEMVEARLWEHGSVLIERVGPSVGARLLPRVNELSDDTFIVLRDAAHAGLLGPVAVDLIAEAVRLRS